jgi:hypothetical protein
MPKAKDVAIPVASLRDCFNCNFETGVLTWRTRPIGHFMNAWRCNHWNSRWAGKPAGHADTDGYLQIGLRFNGRDRLVMVHRIIWALAIGAWPEDEIDHLNGILIDNRLINLRVNINLGEFDDRLDAAKAIVHPFQPIPRGVAIPEIMSWDISAAALPIIKAARRIGNHDLELDA